MNTQSTASRSQIVSESFWEGFRDERDAEVRRLWAEVRKGSVPALKQIERLGGEGSPLACAFIGASLANGTTYRQNLELSLTWWRAAAAHGAPQAFHGAADVLKRLHRPAEAAQEYQRAVALGFSPSMDRLAQMYFDGEGVDADPGTAQRLWRQGARAGNFWAKRNLARRRAAGAFGPRAVCGRDTDLGARRPQEPVRLALHAAPAFTETPPPPRSARRSRR